MTNEIKPRVRRTNQMFTILNPQHVVSKPNWTGLSAGALANSADPDQAPQNAAYDQGMHCLLKLQKLRVK